MGLGFTCFFGAATQYLSLLPHHCLYLPKLRTSLTNIDHTGIPTKPPITKGSNTSVILHYQILCFIEILVRPSNLDLSSSNYRFYMSPKFRILPV